MKIFFPSALVEELKVSGNEEEHSYNISITYNIVNFGITDKINLTIQ